MKIALVGSGKTGQYVAKSKYKTKIFNSKNPFDKTKVSDCDLVICFTTANVLKKNIDDLIETKLPVVVASTGLKEAGIRIDDLDKKLKQNKRRWIYSSNFSTSLFLYKSLIQFIAKQDIEAHDYNLSVEDIHHKDKLDAPSGTALTIQNWYGKEISIKSIRESDHIGTHNFIISNQYEEIKLSHKIKCRSVFAKGAIKAGEILLKTDRLGLIPFYEVLNENE